MIDFAAVMGVARSEARLTRRLARYWVFQVLAFLVGLAAYAYYATIHWFASSFSGTVALIGPRFLLSFLGNMSVLVLCVGLVFLAFDIRARDRKERMVEVLDALPCGNVEWVLGRFLGLLFAAWVPTVVMSALIILVGQIVGETVQPLSGLRFVLFLVLPSFAFTIGLTYLLVLLVRNRLLVAVLAIAVFVALIWINGWVLPIWATPLTDFTGGFSTGFPSDLAPRLIDGVGFVQRVGWFLLGLGLVLLAAAIHPRLDGGSRSLRAASAAGVGLAGLAALALLSLWGQDIVQDRAAWRAAHESVAGEPAPDVTRVEGTVAIDPGDRIDLDLRIEFSAPADVALDTARFTLNPGIEIESIAGPSGPLTFERHDGLVEIALPGGLAAGASLSTTWKAGGEPNIRFAYLDQAFDPLTLTSANGNVFLMGYDPAVFAGDFVALMPGIRWLPQAGADVAASGAGGRAEDFFELDLIVETPDDLIVAGPGRRREADGGAARFAPGAPVPEVALIAAKYVARSTEIEGVTLEILVTPGHQQNLELFADAMQGPIREWIAEHLVAARERGLPYPYDGLTLAEVPNLLRGFGGGWRMDSTFYQPGLILMRESGFPTARFDRRFSDPERFEEQEGGLPAAKRDVLFAFFETDFSGGNVFDGAARNFLDYQTSGAGDAGLPLEYVLEDLTRRLTVDRDAYFSIHHFDADMNTKIGTAIGAAVQAQSENRVEAIIDSFTSSVAVWDQVLETRLTDLDPSDDPARTLDVLTLKGGGMAESLIDDLGDDRTGKLLGALRERTRGGVYRPEDVLAAGRTVEADLGPWIEGWLRTTTLPGFTLRDASIMRIPDTDEGTRRYQTILVVQNDEEVAGLVRVRYFEGSFQDPANLRETDPFRIDPLSAVEVGIVTSELPERIQVEPYLSLNRGPFTVSLNAPDEERIEEAEPFVGLREAEWTAREDDVIEVDDLDEGFSIVDEAPDPWWKFGGGGDEDEVTDQGLPIWAPGRGAPPARWSRYSDPDAHGLYRRTSAIARKGDGDRRAVFSARIPRAGAWELLFHDSYSTAQGRERAAGTYHLRIVDPTGEQEIEYNAKNGVFGWNSLGTFEIAEGEVRVELSNETDTRNVIADAIRWKPAR